MVDKILKDLKEAQLARDEVKVSTLRLLISEIKNAQINKGSSGEQLSDDEVVSVIAREVKKRKESAVGFRSGNREEQALKEEAEGSILQSYLPEQLSTEELTKIVQESINEIGATTVSDMGKVIGLVLGKVKGKAEGSAVSTIVKEMLSK